MINTPIVTIVKNIEKRLGELGWSRSQLAEAAGFKREYISKLLAGKINKPSERTLYKIAKPLKLTVAHLKENAGASTIAEAPEPYQPPGTLPLYGHIPAGTAYEITQYQEGMYPVMPGQHKEGRYILRVCGDSMEPNIRNGDLVLMEKTSGLGTDGKIYAVTLNGESTLKRVFVRGKTVELRADNPSYQPYKITDKDQFAVQAVFVEIVKGLR